MRSLAKLIRIFLVMLYLGLRFALAVLMVEFVFLAQWGLVFGLAIVTGWMYAKDEEVKDWANKI
jgi:hypothetical protein